MGLNNPLSHTGHLRASDRHTEASLVDQTEARTRVSIRDPVYPAKSLELYPLTRLDFG